MKSKKRWMSNCSSRIVIYLRTSSFQSIVTSLICIQLRISQICRALIPLLQLKMAKIKPIRVLSSRLNPKLQETIRPFCLFLTFPSSRISKRRSTSPQLQMINSIQLILGQSPRTCFQVTKTKAAVAKMIIMATVRTAPRSQRSTNRSVSSRPLISSIKRSQPKKMEQMEINPIRMQICTLAISVGKNNKKPMSSTKKRTKMHLETLKVMLSQRMEMMEVGMLSSRKHLSQLNCPNRRQKAQSLINKSKPVLKNNFQNQMKMTKKNLGTSRRPMTLSRIRRKKMISAISVTLMKLNQKNKSMSKRQKIIIAIRLSRRPKNRYQSTMPLSQRIKK